MLLEVLYTISLKCADFTLFKDISKYCKWRRYDASEDDIIFF